MKESAGKFVEKVIENYSFFLFYFISGTSTTNWSIQLTYMYIKNLNVIAKMIWETNDSVRETIREQKSFVKLMES